MFVGCPLFANIAERFTYRLSKTDTDMTHLFFIVNGSHELESTLDLFPKSRMIIGNSVAVLLRIKPLSLFSTACPVPGFNKTSGFRIDLPELSDVQTIRVGVRNFRTRLVERAAFCHLCGADRRLSRNQFHFQQ